MSVNFCSRVSVRRAALVFQTRMAIALPTAERLQLRHGEAIRHLASVLPFLAGASSGGTISYSGLGVPISQ
jgi:hypothetical protein